MKNVLIYILFTAVLSASTAFYGGMMYQKSKIPTRGQFMTGQNSGNIARQRIGANNQAIRGTLSEIGKDTVTVKLRDGSSKLVIVSDTTSINKAATASRNDLKNGDQIVVFGQTNTDGSVIAQNIQVNPKFEYNIESGPPKGQ